MFPDQVHGFRRDAGPMACGEDVTAQFGGIHAQLHPRLSYGAGAGKLFYCLSAENSFNL